MRRLSLLLPVALAAAPASAFLEFQADIPNGAEQSCVTCHQRASGGAPWNAFGDLLFTTNGGTADSAGSIDAFDAGFVWWSTAICNADSDGDGQTNGQELGDPDCVWTEGAAARTTDISNPGDPNSTSANPDGVDGGDGGEGEGEGEDDGGGCAASEASVAVVGLLPALLLVGRRRRR